MAIALLLTACGEVEGPLLVSDQEAGRQFCFKRHVIDDSGDGADGVHLADINRDGFSDVVSGWEESAEVKLYLNPGAKLIAGASWTAIDVGGGQDISAVEDAAFVDLDDDGYPDAIVSATEGKGSATNRRIRIHFPGSTGLPGNWGGNVLYLDEPTDRFMKVRGAQLDGKHGADIVAASRNLFENGDTPEEISHRGGIFLYRAPPHGEIGNPSAWERRRLADVDKGKSIELIDIDGDGDTDILFSGSGSVEWLENPGPQKVRQVWPRRNVGIGSDLAVCDLNADGIQDVIATASRREYPLVARWFQGMDDPRSKQPGNNSMGARWQEHKVRIDSPLPTRFYQPQRFALKSIACGHFSPEANPAGPPQIVITTSGSGYGIILVTPPPGFPDNGGAWSAVPVTDYQWWMKYDNIIAADLDADGDLDLVTSEENEGLMLQGAGVLWYENSSCEEGTDNTPTGVDK